MHLPLLIELIDSGDCGSPVVLSHHEVSGVTNIELVTNLENTSVPGTYPPKINGINWRLYGLKGTDWSLGSIAAEAQGQNDSRDPQACTRLMQSAEKGIPFCEGPSRIMVCH